MRYLIYFVYRADGRVDDYVVEFLKSVRRRFDFIHVVYNGQIASDERQKLSFVDKVQERPNDEFDVGAYKAALFSNPDEFYQECSEVTFANFTFFAPVKSMEPVFKWASQKKVDFWGISAHKSMDPNPFTGKGVLPYHIQSHWITVNARIVRSPDFLSYWRSLPKITSYEDFVLLHESQFTRHFSELGYKYALFLDDSKYDTAYPAFNAIEQVVSEGFPLLKRRIFYHVPFYLDKFDVRLRGAIEHLQQEGSYDLDLVWDSVVDAVDPGVLYQNADLLRVVPDKLTLYGPRKPPPAESEPTTVMLVMQGNLTPANVNKILGEIRAPANLILFVPTEATAAIVTRLVEQGEVANAVSCRCHVVDNLSGCFQSISDCIPKGDMDSDAPILFAMASPGGFADFQYGVRHVFRDSVVAKHARETLMENRFFGLALPVIKTFGERAEADQLTDAVKSELRVDLAGFSVQSRLSDLVLFSQAGVFWVRARLLGAIAEELRSYAAKGRMFNDVGEEDSNEVGDCVGDGKEIESFLSAGLPFFASKKRYVTLVMSNTSELPRNFVKLEARYRRLAEGLEIENALYIDNRVAYLSRFMTQENREEVFRQISTNAFSDGWKKGSQGAWKEAFEAGMKQAATRSGALAKEVLRQEFDRGFQEGWTSSQASSGPPPKVWRRRAGAVARTATRKVSGAYKYLERQIVRLEKKLKDKDKK